MEVGLGSGNIVLDGDPVLPPIKRKRASPIFGPCPLWPNGWMDQDSTWYRARPLPRRHVIDGDPAPPKNKGHSRQFSAHVCGQTAGWIKMPLGTDVGLNSGNGTQLPTFWPIFIAAKRSSISVTGEHCYSM